MRNLPPSIVRVCSLPAMRRAALLGLFTSVGLQAWGPVPVRGHDQTGRLPVTVRVQRMAPCVETRDKSASPELVLVGGVVTVTLKAAISCSSAPEPVDIVLVLDRSGSMAGAPIAALRDAADRFIDAVDLSIHRVAVVSFADEARIDAQLARERGYLHGAVAGLVSYGGTDIAAALRTAGQALERGGTAIPVIVLITDGFNGNGRTAVRQAAAYQRDRGALLATIALEFGADRELLAEIASTPELALVSATSSALSGLMATIAGSLGGVAARNVVVDDVLPPDMEYVPGSASPRPVEEGTTLVWALPALPAHGATLIYRVRPQLVGHRATNVRADARYQAGGVDGAFSFPVPHVRVVAEMPSTTPTPTATSTATSTPTATPTASPTDQSPPPTPAGPRYLPAVFARACAPTGRPADVVVVLDASTTMGGLTSGGRPKIEAAKQGSLELARLLSARGKRVALVAFNTQAAELAALGTDPAAFAAGLARVSIAEGSRIDLGLEQAAAALERGAAGRVVGAGLFVLLVSDGQPAGASPAQVVAAADALRAAGARVSAVAVGADADRELLARVAGDGDVWDAGDGEGFRGAAVSVAGRLDCR